MLTALILMNLMMGGNKLDSIAGFEKCSAGYWIIQFVFVLICVVCTVIAVRLA